MRVIRSAAYGFGRWNRQRKAEFALAVARRLGAESVLLVGVAGTRSPVNNLIEDKLARSLPYVVASGLAGDGEGWDTYVTADGCSLPFRDAAFDLVYSNAVIEHVGGVEEQRRFMSEVARVGRAFIVTTPNRWFPVESHEHTLFTHWLPRWAPRGGVTRLLGKRDLRVLLPFGVVRGIPAVSPTLSAVGVRDPGGRG